MNLFFLLAPLFLANGLDASPGARECRLELVVLGAGQDAGAPQIGNPDDPAWEDASLRLTATSVAVVDRASGERYLFEATPHITAQLQLLDATAPHDRSNLGIDGVFLTHAHMGHYAGLMFLGREAAGTDGIPTYVMPRFADYLSNNGPWSQLVELGNVVIQPLANHTATRVSERLSVTPYRVPHRDEYSETVGFVLETPSSKTLFLPDIDGWGDWQQDYGVELTRVVSDMDLLFVDATFFDDAELPGRDMSEIPHPRVVDTMDLLASLSVADKRKLYFIHYNHTNPIRFATSLESEEVRKQGFNVARTGNRHCLHAADPGKGGHDHANRPPDSGVPAE
jgi:pyrroloquinoline quinone biosynthesis protein B